MKFKGEETDIGLQTQEEGFDPLGAFHSFAKGATFGFADELGAAELAGLMAMKNIVQGKPADFEQNYGALRDAVRTRQEQFAANNPKTATGLEMAGGVATAAPLSAALPVAPALIARVGQQAAVGAGSAGLAAAGESKGDISERATEAVKAAPIGAALGGATAPLMGGAARVAKPQSSPEIQKLISEGVSITPGQAAGPTAKRIEESAAGLPFIGDIVKAAQLRAVQTFDRAVLNRTLAPIGERLPKELIAGREAIEATAEKVGKAYDAILPKITAKLDRQFFRDLGALDLEAGILEEGLAKQYRNILKTKVLDKFTNREMAGEAMKNVESELGQLAKSYRTSNLASERELGGLISDLQSSLRELVTRGNPEAASRLKAINKSYAMLARVEKAAGGVGAHEGVFTPAQFNSAVRAMDTSARKRSFASGKAMMQDIGDAGSSVLSRTVPDSGTPYRMLGNAMLLGGGTMIHPAVAVWLGAASGAYTRPGQYLATAAISRRPELATTLSEIVRRGSPAVASSLGQQGATD